MCAYHIAQGSSFHKVHATMFLLDGFLQITTLSAKHHLMTVVNSQVYLGRETFSWLSAFQICSFRDMDWDGLWQQQHL